MKPQPFSSELFVIDSIKNSEKITAFQPAFSAVANEILVQNLSQMLRVLQNERRLKEISLEKSVEYEHIFEDLKRAIFRSFEQRSISHSRLTLHHVKRLLDADIHEILAEEVLGGSSDDALQALLDAPKLQETLDYLTDGRSPLSNNVMILLTEILKPSHVQKLQNDKNTTPNNWESIFREEEWLSEISGKQLEQSENLKSTDPLKALAELIDRSQVEENENLQDNDQVNFLDSLALLELRRRISWIISKLHEQALDYAENAASSLPDSSSVQLFLPILYLHGLGAIAKSLNSFISQPKTLKELLKESKVDVQFEVFEVKEDRVLRDHSLVITKMAIFKNQQNEKFASFQIKCKLSGWLGRIFAPIQPILIAYGVPIEIYQQLERDIPKLTPNDLNIIGKKLHKRLLNTSFPLPNPQEALLKEAVKQLGSSFIQAIALTYKNPLDIIPENIWTKQLDSHLHDLDLPVQDDTYYSQGIEKIRQNFEKKYSQQLKIFRGTDINKLNDIE